MDIDIFVDVPSTDILHWSEPWAIELFIEKNYKVHISAAAT